MRRAADRWYRRAPARAPTATRIGSRQQQPPRRDAWPRSAADRQPRSPARATSAGRHAGERRSAPRRDRRSPTPAGGAGVTSIRNSARAIASSITTAWCASKTSRQHRLPQAAEDVVALGPRSARGAARPRRGCVDRAAELRVGGERQHQQRQRRPEPRRARQHRPAGGEQQRPAPAAPGCGAGCRESSSARSPAGVLGTAPAARVGHRPPEPARDLPVAADPAVLPRGERSGSGTGSRRRAGCRCTGRARVRAFEEVVAEQRVLRARGPRARPRTRRRRRCPCRRSCPRGTGPGRRRTPRSCTGRCRRGRKRPARTGVRFALTTLTATRGCRTP